MSASAADSPSSTASAPLSSAPDLVEIPDAFLCPITNDIMVSPVMTRSGQSFDRTAILEWLVNHGNTCPLTRQPLNASNLVTNHALRIRIDQWCKANNYYPAVDKMIEDKAFSSANNMCLVTCLSSALTEQRKRKVKRSIRQAAGSSSPAVDEDTHVLSPRAGRARRASILNILRSADAVLGNR